MEGERKERRKTEGLGLFLRNNDFSYYAGYGIYLMFTYI